MTDSSSSKKILVTGSEGFIAKNLIHKLNEIGSYSILTFSKKQTISELEELVHESDFIFHLAGENRPKNNEDFKINNIQLTKEICNSIRSQDRNIPIVFSSSIQALSDTNYGKSKLKAEECISELVEEKGRSGTIFRLPGIFGKWCKPNYNSVVATFCYNIANDKEVFVSDQKNKVALCYIDDLVADMIEVIDQKDDGLSFKEVSICYEINLKDLLEMIYSFQRCRDYHVIGSVGTGLERALYSTYMSYLPPSKFSYSLKQNIDERGAFVEMLKTKNSGQFSFFTSNPGVTRGEHYHHTKTEKFLVLKGKARFRFRNIATNDRYEIFTDESQSIIVETIPGWAHDIKNIGDDTMIVMLWANEIFRLEHPDTYSSKTF